MSNISGDGIADVKAKACDILLDHRLTQKNKDPKKQEAIMNRLHIAQPKKRDNVDRPANTPKTVLDGVKKVGPTVKQLQEEFGGAGRFYIPEEEHYLLEKEEWRYDKFPEFYNGSNVLDFYDPDIEKKLDALEAEEEELLKMEGLEDEIQAKENEESENSDDVDL
jgi:nucleolar GTP-binding protein